MSNLTYKIDFAVIVSVNHANPNGDPLNGNRPRTDYAGIGEITDVCLKRKIRDRLMEMGFLIFVQPDDRKLDDATSLADRARRALESDFGSSEMVRRACALWFDVRAFGQLFAFRGKKGSSIGDTGYTAGGVSIGVRGPVTVQSAFSIEPIDVTSVQITKSVSGEGDGTKRGSDTMGMKHRVDRAVYVFYGSMNPHLAIRTGFNDADAEAIKLVLPRMFENDASAARPEGSMMVLKVIWWKHNCRAGQYSSAKVHSSLEVRADGTYALDVLERLVPEEIDGF